MVEDKVVKMLGAVWKCVDVGFGRNKPVDAVIARQDIDLVKPGEGVIDGVVTNLIFKGVIMRWKCLPITTSCLSTAQISSLRYRSRYPVDPFDIQIMEKNPESEMRMAPALEDIEKLLARPHTLFLGRFLSLIIPLLMIVYYGLTDKEGILHFPIWE